MPKRAPSAWNKHVAAYRKKHPNKTMKQCLKDAAKTYKKKPLK